MRSSVALAGPLGEIKSLLALHYLQRSIGDALETQGTLQIHQTHARQDSRPPRHYPTAKDTHTRHTHKDTHCEKIEKQDAIRNSHKRHKDCPAETHKCPLKDDTHKLQTHSSPILLLLLLLLRLLLVWLQDSNPLLLLLLLVVLISCVSC